MINEKWIIDKGIEKKSPQAKITFDPSEWILSLKAISKKINFTRQEQKVMILGKGIKRDNFISR